MTRAVIAICSLAILVEGAVLVTGPETRLAHLFYDDAFYYLEVARRLAAGGGSTFDGINASNGYHPLWCWLLVPIQGVIADPGLAMRVTAALWFALAAAVPPLLAWVVRPRSPGSAPALAAIACLHPFLVLHLQRPSGLETPLFAVVLLLFAGALERSAFSTFARTLGLGALLGALILARMDAGMYAVAAAALMVAGPRRKMVVPLALGAVIVAGPSLIWNTARFGSPMPISGRVVRAYQEPAIVAMGGAWSAAHLAERMDVAGREIPLLVASHAVAGTPVARAIERGGWIAALAVVAAIIAVIVLAIRRRRSNAGIDALLLLACGTALHYAVYGGWFWVGGEEALFRLYYFMPEGLLVAASLGAVLGPAIDRLTLKARSLLLGTLCALAIIYLALACRASWSHDPSSPEPMTRHHLYGWVRENLPPDAVLAMLGSGRLGYFGGHPVVNLDGLINGPEFLEALRKDDVDGFLFRSPVRYVVTHRGSLFGFDPDHPETPPAPRADTGETLYRLVERHGCRLRAVPGTPDTTVVVEILRP